MDAHLDEKAEKELMLNGLEKGLSALKPEQQQCVTLFYLEELSYKDIAEKTGFMAKQRNIGLTQNGLLTEEAVRCYMEGSLTEEQRKEVEAILANDPFAQDAIEGIQPVARKLPELGAERRPAPRIHPL